MKLYWTFNDITELRGLPRAEQRRLWRRVQGPAYRHWETWLAVAILCAICGTGQYFFGVLGVGLGGGIGGLVFGRFACAARGHTYAVGIARTQMTGPACIQR